MMHGRAITTLIAAALAAGVNTNLPPIHFVDSYTYNGPALRGRRGAGITMAQQQRAARKVRNVRRHKQHVRGAR